jgi:hypothetical protein
MEVSTETEKNKCMFGRTMAQAVSHRGGPGSCSDQSIWDLCWTKWHCDRFLSEFFGFPFHYHSTVAIHTHISSGEWTISPLVAAVHRRSHPIGMDNIRGRKRQDDRHKLQTPTEELHYFCYTSYIIVMITPRGVSWEVHVTCLEEVRSCWDK